MLILISIYINNHFTYIPCSILNIWLHVNIRTSQHRSNGKIVFLFVFVTFNTVMHLDSCVTFNSILCILLLNFNLTSHICINPSQSQLCACVVMRKF